MSSEKDTPAAKKSPKKLIIFGAIGLVLAGSAGGAAWFMTQKKGEHAEAEAPKRKALPKSVFIPLDNFTVNLQDEGGDHYAQIGVTLEVEDASVETDLKARLPALRNNILLLIAAKKVEDLLTLEGKQRLASQIGIRAAQSIGIDVSDADLPPLPQPAAPAAAAPAVAAETAAPAPAPVAAAAPASAAHAGKPKVDNPIKNVLFSQFLVQ